jgi:hypothetical protein
MVSATLIFQGHLMKAQVVAAASIAHAGTASTTIYSSWQRGRYAG